MNSMPAHELQFWAAVISRGPRNYPLNASFKNTDSYAFQVLCDIYAKFSFVNLYFPLSDVVVFFVKDALGISLEEICKIVPGGCLIFFPSYKLMEKLSTRWKETGQWARLNARKPLFVGKKH